MRGELARDRLQRGSRQQAFKDPAKGSAQPHFHLGHAQQVSRAAPQPLQVHIVHPHHLAAVNIDDLPVNQVLLQIDIVAVILERNQRPGGPQLQRARRRLHHILRGHNAQSGAGLQHQPGDLARIRPRGHGNVLQPPAQMPLRIGHRGAEQRRQADPGCGPGLHEVSVLLPSGFRPVDAGSENHNHNSSRFQSHAFPA